MKPRAIFVSLLLIFSTNAIAQTRTITGKIIEEKFYPVYKAGIFNTDTVLIATADTNGNFTVTVPSDTKSLIIGSLAMEWKYINLTEDCNHFDIILQNDATYDFISARRVDKLRKKEFDRLLKLYQSAFEKGIFKTDKPCYAEKFIPIRKRLRQIHRNRTDMF